MSTETPPVTDEPIDRADTGVRILLSLLFFVIVRVVETVLLVVILFELIAALITRREPSAQVKRFASRALSYAVVVVRYLTYHSDQAPFPFEEFPPELDFSKAANRPRSEPARAKPAQ